MPAARHALGMAGEALARQTLESQGYRILAQNYRTPWGEVDLVARHDAALVFVEVKTRRSTTYGSAREAVSQQKQARLRKAAEHFMQHHPLDYQEIRFDVVAITLTGLAPQIEVIVDAFGG